MKNENINEIKSLKIVIIGQKRSGKLTYSVIYIGKTSFQEEITTSTQNSGIYIYIYNA